MNAALLTLTLVHVAISLVGIATGFVEIAGLLSGTRREGWTKVFLASTIATSATGFLFPFERFLPSHAFGLISLALLGVALAARYHHHLNGRWSAVYAVTAIVAQYLNFFVLVVQSFLKVPGLKTLAPTQTEPPFVIAQLVTLVAFSVLGALATRRALMNTSNASVGLRHA
jgi:hypothetical protein